LTNRSLDTRGDSAETASSAEVTDAKHVPGEPGVWVLIIGDLLIFAVFFVSFGYYRAHQLSVFTQSQGQLNRTLGLANTIVLLTSSLLVAVGVRRARAGTGVPRRYILAAAGCGAVFVLIKSVEYFEKISEGITFSTNMFFTFYFSLTGIHLLHVLIGTAVLVFIAPIAVRVRAGNPKQPDVVMLESGASFWHLVDVLWIVLFSILYLL
jgi:nitric oxide reductase NorE protein